MTFLSAIHTSYENRELKEIKTYKACSCDVSKTTHIFGYTALHCSMYSCIKSHSMLIALGDIMSFHIMWNHGKLVAHQCIHTLLAICHYFFVHPEEGWNNSPKLVQFGTSALFLDPSNSLPCLSTHQHSPVLPWHWTGAKWPSAEQRGIKVPSNFFSLACLRWSWQVLSSGIEVVMPSEM